MADGPAQGWRRALAALALAGVTCLSGLAAPLLAVAADLPPDPDAACAHESTFRSTDGTTTASLKVINNTDQTVQTFWLDYAGKRVFYKQVAPHASYIQPTWLTHPWIVASLTGTCYRLVVVTSLEQIVTLDPGEGGIGVPPAPTLEPAVTFPPPLETFPPAGTVAPAGAGMFGPPASDNGQGFPILPLAIAALAVVAAFGGLKVLGGAKEARKDAGKEIGRIVEASGAAPKPNATTTWEAEGTPRSSTGTVEQTDDPRPFKGALGRIVPTDDLDDLGADLGKVIGEQQPKRP